MITRSFYEPAITGPNPYRCRLYSVLTLIPKVGMDYKIPGGAEFRKPIKWMVPRMSSPLTCFAEHHKPVIEQCLVGLKTVFLLS